MADNNRRIQSTSKASTTRWTIGSISALDHPPSGGSRTFYFAGVTWTYQPPKVGSIVMLRPLGPS